MLGPFIGSVLLLFGLVIIGYTIYWMITHHPTSTADWVFDCFYIVSGLINMYFGYQTLYPPQPTFMGVGGLRRR